MADDGLFGMVVNHTPFFLRYKCDYILTTQLYPDIHGYDEAPNVSCIIAKTSRCSTDKAFVLARP
jgi:hypothetical protein